VKRFPTLRIGSWRGPQSGLYRKVKLPRKALLWPQMTGMSEVTVVDGRLLPGQ